MAEFSDAKIKHLEMLQRVIERMATESARMKQFCLVAIAALASTATATGAWGLALVGVLLTLVFWSLDAKYLAQERWFRELYNFSRSSDAPPDFVITPSAAVRAKHPHTVAMLGWSVSILYGSLICINIGIALAIGVAGTTP